MQRRLAKAVLLQIVNNSSIKTWDAYSWSLDGRVSCTILIDVADKGPGVSEEDAKRYRKSLRDASIS